MPLGSSLCRLPKLQPFWMGMLVSVLVGIALTLPICLGGHLFGLGIGRLGRRRGGGWLLRQHGGLCGALL